MRNCQAHLLNFKATGFPSPFSSQDVI